MSNLLKFLLTVALGLCFIFSVMLMVGCEENSSNIECPPAYFFDENLNKCTMIDCDEDKITPEAEADEDSFSPCGCYNHHVIYCTKDAKDILVLTRINLLSYTE